MNTSSPGTHELFVYAIVLGVFAGCLQVAKSILWEKKRKKRKKYYNEEYLQSTDWKKKREMVMRRDKWKCVLCGQKATEIHHKRYARKNIGKEPIEWLIAVCKECHEKEHQEQRL